ncbi:MAG: response regulator [Alphaproteobacteria bacterium]|nr:response regulator [Alphaproteobacteria bacterium]
MNELIRQGVAFRDLLFPTLHRDGRRVMLLLSGQPKYDAQGRLAGDIGSGTDITAHLRSQSELHQANNQLIALTRLLKENEARFRDFAEVSSDWTWETDREGRITHISDSLERSANIEAKAFVGLCSGQALRHHPEAELCVAPIMAARKALQPYHDVTLPLRTPTGEDLHVAVSGRPFFDEEGTFQGYRGTGRNITELVLNRQALARETALLNAILDNLGKGVAVYDAGQRLRVWNPSSQQLLEFPPGFLRIGRPWADVSQFHAGRGDFPDRAPSDLPEGAPPSQWNMPNGRIVQHRRNPMPEGGFVDTFTDVSQLISKEIQLRQAQKMEAIGHLTGGVAHEFNNLLTVIGGFARRAERRIDDRALVAESLSEVVHAADRAAELTQQMLVFARKQATTPELLRLADVLPGLARLLGPLPGETTELTIDASGSRGLVRVDRGQLTQILLNLAVNARDAMGPGGRLGIVTEDVRLPPGFAASHLGQGGGDYCRLTVSDSGSGMDETVRKHLFEPFYTTKEQGKGTGLGLAAVYGIVEQSGGTIDVASTPGEGSAFTLYFPLAPAEAPAATDAATAATPESELPLPATTATILLAEDEAAVRRPLASDLRAFGFSVIEAADGRHAVGLAQAYSGTIDLLLTDLAMPRMSGEEAASTLRQGQPSLKVVYMTGDATCLPNGEPRPAGAVLRKPFTDVELRKTVQQVLTPTGS